MVLANQHLSQLSTSMRDAIITNGRNKIMFQGNADDGSTLARHMSNKINSGDIVNLRTFEAIASILTPVGNGGPATINTRPPGKVTGVSGHVRAFSQKAYGRPVDTVYQEMIKRFEQPEKRN